MKTSKLSRSTAIRSGVTTVLLASMLAACGPGATGLRRDTRRASASRAQGARGITQGAADGGACDATVDGREVSEYDTSGDDIPDVRKVFRRVGDGSLVRLVMICREQDLNGDGRKDVVRYYHEEGDEAGRPHHEEVDRNFDGQMDQVTFFDGGRVVRQEIDQDGNGKVDTKIFFENGNPVRAERDLTGRSTPDSWRPDRWEYYEEGNIIRMGNDLDGDGRVDTWDRDDEAHQRIEDERERQLLAQREAEERERREAEGEEEDAEGDEGAAENTEDGESAE